MSGKSQKKLRRLYRKDYRGLTQEIVTSGIMAKFIKPKPRWWPLWFWRYCLSKIIGVNINQKNGSQNNQNQQS